MAKEKNNKITVSQSNALTSSRYDFSRMEKNVLYQIIHKVREDYIEGTIRRDLWQNMYVNILHEDLVQVADKDHTAEARKALRSLRHKDIEIEDEDGNWLNVGFINYAKYKSKEKVYEIEVSKEIMPHLVELAKNFTSYSLTVAISLKSKYSQRFYELACQYKNRGSFFLKADKLREFMKLENKYGQNQDLKRYVLDVARDELKEVYENGQSDLYFDYIADGRGKDITYKFRIYTREEDGQNEKLWKECHDKAIWLYVQTRKILPKNKALADRLQKHLNMDPTPVDDMAKKLNRILEKFTGAERSKIWTWCLHEDFGIK